MPRLTDPAAIRALLETDRSWSAYALGDLAPGFAQYAEWLITGKDVGQALVLLYRAFATPVLFTLGDPPAVSRLLDEIGNESKMYLSVRPEILPLVQARWRVEHARPMWRMIVTPAAFRPVPAGGVTRLSRDDLPALRRLYADGEAENETPDFFREEMVENGVYCGVREGGELIAAAGTHLVAPTEIVGAVGNVYTRRDRRGRGLAVRVTSAVTAQLLAMQLRTVALNVAPGNPAAMRVYEELGYARYCPFYEGTATRESEWKHF